MFLQFNQQGHTKSSLTLWPWTFLD